MFEKPTGTFNKKCGHTENECTGACPNLALASVDVIHQTSLITKQRQTRLGARASLSSKGDKMSNHRITESQNVQDWEGPLWVI